MCNHCELHGARATHQRALAAKARDGYVRDSHLKLAELHEARIAEYRALHG